MPGVGTPGEDLRHVPAPDLPLALADLHLATHVGTEVELWIGAHHPMSECGNRETSGAGLFGSPLEWACAMAEGAGFAVGRATANGDQIQIVAVRLRTLADIVGPRMRLLVCGLNPSPYAADAGVGFARPGNRFWPAALAAGIVDVDRDPRRALVDHGIGFTDLVKRTTRRAAELSTDEYRRGADRVRSLVEWLAPGALCFVGLSGYRSAVDRKAVAGWQSAPFGSRPTYVMPNPSGINAHTSVEQLREHLRAAVSGAT